MFDVDISLNNKNFYDISISNGDFVVDKTVKSPFLCSIYTDKRYSLDSHFPRDKYSSIKLGGYWANVYKNIEQGSLFWCSSKMRQNDSQEFMINTLKEATSWISNIVDITLSYSKNNDIEINYKTEGKIEDFNFKDIF